MLQKLLINCYYKVTYALKIIPRNVRLNESNFEKSPYAGFQEQAGVSGVLRQDDTVGVKKS